MFMGEKKKKNFFSSGVPLKTTERLGKAVTSSAAMMLHCLHNASQEVHTHTLILAKPKQKNATDWKLLWVTGFVCTTFLDSPQPWSYKQHQHSFISHALY